MKKIRVPREAIELWKEQKESRDLYSDKDLLQYINNLIENHSKKIENKGK